MIRTIAIVAALAGVAAAGPDLRLHHAPGPRHLRMRPRSAQAQAPQRDMPPPPSPAVVVAPVAAAPSGSAGVVRDIRRPISARFSMGYTVDGTALTDKPTLDGRGVRSDDFRRLRAYAIGEGTFSSRGVLLPSLSTYFAGGFQIAQPQRELEPDRMGNRTIAPPIATWFDRTGYQGRSAWLEVKDFLDDKRYAPLRVRGGQLYVYGPWVLHMYGGIAAWDGKLAKLSIYGGSRVPDYTLVEVTDRDRSGIFGASAHFDLRALKAKIPFAFGIEALQFTARGAATDQASQHGLVQLDWRPRTDVALIGQARLLDKELANEHIQLRSRWRQVTNLVFDLSYRSDKDWRWDPAVTNPDPLQARRYLDLGPVVPQVMFSGRAGTLIKENVDVLVRGAVASDRASTDQARSTYTARYYELGGGIEMRLRRTIALGVTGLTRKTRRYDTPMTVTEDVPGEIEPLPRPYSANLGETSFVEAGTSLRMSLGARRFSAIAEAYGRRTNYATVYCVGVDCQNALDSGIPDSDFRWGGRVTIDAWIGSRLRLFASYELSSRIDFYPEVTGFKSLRLMMEGVY